jgi:uncharacterized membrane protein HdeD (DUF308 family)
MTDLPPPFSQAVLPPEDQIISVEAKGISSVSVPKTVESNDERITQTADDNTPNPTSKSKIDPKAQEPIEEPEIVDETLEKCWPFFYTEGLVLFSLGMGSLTLPAMAGEGFFREIVGALLVMAGMMKGIRSFQARELPGFSPSLASAVLTLVIGTLLTVYPHDSFLDERVALSIYFMIQTVTNFVFSGQFYKYPYAGGYKFVSLTSFVMLIMLSFGLLKQEALFPSIFTGTLMMLEGSLVFGVALGLQRMARGLPYLHGESN